MAIYHLKHASVGRSTHAAGTAGAHVSYITRTGACREVLGSDMPIPTAGERGGEARAWLDAQEEADRKNARVIDKVTIALPRELDEAQRVELVRTFAAEVTQGRVPWLAAVHDQGKDAENPHAHVVLRDRHVETGKMALRMSQSGSTEMLRETWERVCNAALERAGVENRIDRRTLQAQGISREPTKHIGPIAQAIETSGRTSWKVCAIRDEAEERKRRKAAVIASVVDAVIDHRAAVIASVVDAVIDHRAAVIASVVDAVIDHKAALTAPAPAPEPQEAPPVPQTARLDPVTRAATFPTSKARWPWERFEAMSNIQDPATRKSALAVWVGRIIKDWDGLKDRMASFWTVTGRKDAAKQLEASAAEFPDVVAPLAEKIEAHNADLAAQEAARRQAEVEADRISKAERARQQSNTGLKR